MAHLVEVTSLLEPDGNVRIYVATGELFFAATNELIQAFDYGDADAASVIIDLVEAHVWDSSAVGTLDAVVAKFAARGITAEMVGLNLQSSALHARLTGHLASSH